MSRHDLAPLFIATGIGLLLCMSLPFLGFASFNVLYFARELLASTPTSAPTAPPITPTPAASATAEASPVCDGPPAMFLLLIGSDSRAASYSAGLADSIRIVRADFIHPGLSFLTFQRDLYVEIPGISSHGGITHGKLNQAYLYGNAAFGYYDGAGQGPGLLALTLRENFGAKVDHYVAVNIPTFVRVVDELGGLDIDLPYTVDGRVTRSKDPNRFFPAGSQHLNGYRTMLLARVRPNGDLERSDVQNLILQALAAKMLSPVALPKMPALIETFYGAVQTDMGVDEIRKLLCLASMLDGSKISAVDFPEEIFTGTRIHDPVLGYTFVWDVDFGLLRAYVRHFYDGTWPQATIPIR